MFPRCFRPDGTYDLTRLGRDHDGGYLVDPASVAQARSLLSCGISTDWSFERDFCQKNNAPVHAYDGTINARRIMQRILRYFFQLRPQRMLSAIWVSIDYFRFFRASRTHHRLNIGYDSEDNRALRSIFQEEGMSTPVFIKMDIEGSEYRTLDDLVEHASGISGLVIEFHDVDLHREKIACFIEEFPLTLIHIHSNNCSFMVDAQGDPLTVELTFSACPTRLSDAPRIPHPLDQLNSPKQSAIPLRFE